VTGSAVCDFIPTLTRALKSLGLPFLLLLALGGIGFWIVQTAPFRTQSIPTRGGELRLVSLQGGHVHANPFESPWTLLLAKIPPGVARILHLPPTPSFPSNGGANTNTFLTCWLLLPSNFPAAPPGVGSPTLGIQIADDHGNLSGEERYGAPAGTNADGRRWESHRINIVPRRSEWIRIRVDDAPWSGTRIGEFRVRNPLWDPKTPPLAGMPLPAKASDGDLEATLERFVVLTNNPAAMSGTFQRANAARLEFTLHEGGTPTTNWVAYHVADVRDATGNQSDGNSWNHGWQSGRSYVQFSQHPLPHDEAWRTDVEFCQRSGFPAHEVWRLRHLPIAASDAGYAAATNTLHGTEITLQSVVNDPDYRNLVDTNPPVHVLVKLKAAKSPDSRRWHLTIARAVDDLGKDVTGNAWNGSDDKREFMLQLSPGAKAVDVDVAFAPARRMVFVARPGMAAHPD